eukprot:COSAG01_NODE_4328_length_5129_cov_15.312724_8_plen_127_part_00
MLLRAAAVIIASICSVLLAAHTAPAQPLRGGRASSSLPSLLLPPVQRAQKLLAQMNATEKYQMLSGIWGLGWAPPDQQGLHGYVGNVRGVPRLGIPWLSLQDGPQVGGGPTISHSVIMTDSVCRAE